MKNVIKFFVLHERILQEGVGLDLFKWYIRAQYYLNAKNKKW